MTEPYREEATYLRAALLLGLARGESIVAWADEAIRRDPSTPPEMLDVSLTPAGDLTALRHALRPLADDTESPDVTRRVLETVAGDLMSGRRGFADTVHVLRQMHRMIAMSDTLEAELSNIEHAHMLAEAGVEGDLAAIESRARDWLGQFASEDRRTTPAS